MFSVPDAVTGLKFTNVKDTSLVVMWLPPTNTNGILTGIPVCSLENEWPSSRVYLIQFGSSLLNTYVHFQLCCNSW